VIVAAAQEERFTRKKGDAGFPSTPRTIAQGRGIAGRPGVRRFYDKPLLKFERISRPTGRRTRGFTQFRLADLRG